MNLTVVIPVFNELESLESLVESIHQHAAQYNPRILFIDDGSTDGSSDKLDELHARFVNIDVVRFHRNRGKSDALAAGFARATGDVVVTMDADMQDDPKEIPRFIEKLNEGYDLVNGWKQVRHDPLDKTLPSRIYNGLIDRLFNLGLHDINCGFKAMRLEVAKSIRLFGDMHRLIPALASDRGYKVGEIAVEHHPRRHGVSKYGCERFLRGATDAITLYFLTRHRDAPNHLLGGWGLIFGGAGALALLLGALTRWSGAWLTGIVMISAGTCLLGLGLVAELVVRSSKGLPAEEEPVEHLHK